MRSEPYMTVPEMREFHRVNPRSAEEPSTRFEGTTDPPLALKYFTDKNAHILECGPHTGTFSKFLFEHGYKNIHAVDFFDSFLAMQKSQIDYRIADLNTEPLPYPDSYFRGVTAWGIGEHMENPFHFMREVHRTMIPGGIFIFALPNIFHIVSRLMFLKIGDFPRWNKRNNHIMIFSRATFRKTFLRFFDLVETKYTRPGIEYPFLGRLGRLLPANQWFGNYVVYVLKKKQS